MTRCSLDWCLVSTGFPARSMRGGPFLSSSLVILNLIGISWWKFRYILKKLLSIKSTTKLNICRQCRERVHGRVKFKVQYIYCVSFEITWSLHSICHPTRILFAGHFLVFVGDWIILPSRKPELSHYMSSFKGLNPIMRGSFSSVFINFTMRPRTCFLSFRHTECISWKWCSLIERRRATK